jgi:hypothetical protein
MTEDSKDAWQFATSNARFERALSRSHQPVGLLADPRIAFAGTGLQTVAVDDFDMSTPVPDEPCLLHGMGLDRNGSSSHAQHVGKKFLGQAENVASDHVLGLQQPAAKATTD